MGDDGAEASFAIERLAVPVTLEAPDARDFVASVEVRNASECRAYGTAEVAYPAAEMLPQWNDPFAPKVLWVARVRGSEGAGRIVARAVHEAQLGSEREIGWIDIDVHPEFERRGIGRALAETVEQYARSLGQDRLICYAVSPPPSRDDPPDRPAAGMIAPPTGFGAVPAGNREVRFLLARGYRLEQVERASRFALPADRAKLADRRAAAQTAAGEDYRAHSWAGPTAPAWQGDLAWLLTRMSTDAPSAGLEEPEDVWSAERLAEDERRASTATRTTLTTAVEHVPSRRLVAFTQLEVPHDVARPVSQADTLVLREHRGHRLGMLVKTANLEFLEEVAPGHPSVLTWNAEENRLMLDVNEALGFIPLGYEGAWRLGLT